MNYNLDGDAPDIGAMVPERLVEADKSKRAASSEDRTIGFEVQIPKDASGTIRVPVFALYHVCNDAGGQCRFLRLDATVEVKVK